MRFLIQRVKSATLSIDGQEFSHIGMGDLVLVGIAHGDTTETADKLIRKLIGLRIFEDEAGKTNLSLADVGGELMLVSQFTLYADCKHGNRPGFTTAGDPEPARKLYDYIVEKCSGELPVVARGVFGADMQYHYILSSMTDGMISMQMWCS